MEIKELYTINDIAEILEKSDRTIYEWVRRDVIHAVKIGNSWRISRKELERIIESGIDDEVYSKKNKH